VSRESKLNASIVVLPGGEINRRLGTMKDMVCHRECFKLKSKEVEISIGELKVNWNCSIERVSQGEVKEMNKKGNRCSGNSTRMKRWWISMNLIFRWKRGEERLSLIQDISISLYAGIKGSRIIVIRQGKWNLRYLYPYSERYEPSQTIWKMEHADRGEQRDGR